MAISISDIIAQNTVSNSGARPAGVPTSYSWYNGKSGSASASAPPSGFTSVTSWGQVYQEAGGSSYYNPNATVDIANAKTYVHLKATGEWVLVQSQATSSIAGGHFVNDFSGNSAISMKLTKSADGTVAMAAPPAGYNDHFWPTSRGVYPADAIDGVYVQMDIKVSDPNMDLVANIGADWWRSASAQFVNGFGNNPGVGMNNWAKLSTDWTTLGYYSLSTSQFQASPPPLVGSGPTTPPVTGTPDTTAPAAPKIVAFTPDTGTVGDKITTASVLTLSGTAEAGSTVKLFDGTTQIGTAKANASGAWSVATTKLSGGSHNFTARAADAAGNTSSASSPLSVRVDAAPVTSPPTNIPPVTSPPATGANLLVNGSFEQSSVAAGTWEGFAAIPGWTALTGGTIELWNNLNNVKATNGSNFGELDFLGGRDGFYQTVKTVAGQSYDLTFDARSRPWPTGATNKLEALWNDQVVASVDPSASGWNNFKFSVTGTGGQDRLTFREAAGQSADGLGALFDNVSLVAASSRGTSALPQTSVTQQLGAVTQQPRAATQQPSLVTQQPDALGRAPGTIITERSMDLLNQYAATSSGDRGAGLAGLVRQTDLSTSLAQTLARSH
jgi:hypothetical protein